MKTKIVLAISTLALFACNSGGTGTKPNVNLTTEIDSVSYSIATGQAKRLLEQVPNLNLDAFVQGYLDVADSTDLKISDADGQKLLQVYGQKLQKEQQAKLESESVGIKQEGLDFLEANKVKEGVKVTESGLQYMVIKEGTGKQPEGPTTNVTVHYTGTTPDGTKFDSSVDRGEPSSFALNGVIKGWTEGVQLMKEGAKYKFFIPQELAYGANPRPGSPIKPFMPLVFDIELIKVN